MGGADNLFHGRLTAAGRQPHRSASFLTVIVARKLLSRTVGKKKWIRKFYGRRLVAWAAGRFLACQES